MTREKALADLVQSRQAFQQAIEGLSEEQMTQVRVEGVWTVKDVIGHVAAWESIIAEPVRAYAQGGDFVCEARDYLAFNDEDSARKRDVPLDEILKESATVRQDLLTVFGELSAEQLETQVTYPWGETGTIVRMVGMMAGHETEHTQPIQDWRKGDKATG